MRALGLDIGDKRIGIAVSDTNGTIALPVTVYTRSTVVRDIEEIGGLVTTYGVSLIVVGLPKNMDGSIGDRARAVMAFAEKIEKALSVPVEMWDERFSTNEVHRIFDMASMKQKKRKEFVDKMAAQVILQGYLDARANA